MRLTIDGLARRLTPIKDFRAAHGLPPEFGVAAFEPKDYSGLGRIDRAGAALNAVRAAMLDALPPSLTTSGWLAFLPDYARLFETQLYAINDQVGLREAEIGFAVAGLSDVLHHVVYGLARGIRGGVTATDFFQRIYADWLDSGVKVFSQVYSYEHQGQAWRVQLFGHAYGRAGLVVRAGDETHYVYDPGLGCPAEGFMFSLLAEISARILTAIQP